MMTHTESLTDDNHVLSPCVRRCCLDESDVCLGCFRSLEEITHWSCVDNAMRQQFLRNAQQRQRDRAA